jgi:A/G-specific adenine glycosylase
VKISKVPGRGPGGKRRLFLRRLRRWFGNYGRRYPWRDTEDPFQIFIAEFMLQRTGGQQVLPVYKRFVAEFPTLMSAVEVPGEKMADILRPLGRTERYRLLLRALRFVISEYRGCFPKAPKALEEIPGVGPYTARAIGCFGYGKRLGLFDPTIARVLDRIFGIRSARKRPHTDPGMWAAVDQLVPRKRVREFNLAVLDFGALVCRKRNPHCLECPMNDICLYWEDQKAS